MLSSGFSRTALFVSIVLTVSLLYSSSQSSSAASNQQQTKRGGSAFSLATLVKGTYVDTVAAIVDDVAKNGQLPLATSDLTPLDIVVHFGGESVSADHLARLMEAVERNDDPLGIIPQWNESLRLTLRSVQKHILCPPKADSKFNVQTVFILVPSGDAVPPWISTLNTVEAKEIPRECQNGTLSTVKFRVVTHENLSAGSSSIFNPYALEALIADLHLAAHFLYVPAGTALVRPVVRDEMFVPAQSSSQEGLLFPKQLISEDVLASRQEPTPEFPQSYRPHEVLARRVGTVAHHIFDRGTIAFNASRAALFSVQLVNTYLFKEYVIGKLDSETTVQSSDPELLKLPKRAALVIAKEKRITVPSAKKSVTPLGLHAALHLSLALSLEGADLNTHLLHQNVHFADAGNALETTKELAAKGGSSLLLFSVRWVPTPIAAAKMNQNVWGRQVDELTTQSSKLLDVMKVSTPFVSEMAASKPSPGRIPPLPTPEPETPAPETPVPQTPVPPESTRPPIKMLFEKTLVFPPPTDNVSSFPCGQLRVRNLKSPIPSGATISDLMFAESPQQNRSLPPWNYIPNGSRPAPPVTLASMMCWFPGRPPHALPDEVPEVSNIPKLEKRVGPQWTHFLDGHHEETSVNHTVKHQRLATVDMVYTYVKGDAPKWLKEMRKAERDIGIEQDDNRIRDWDELKYSLRSLERFACRNGDCCGQESGLGIGAIYIVAASEEHVPDWMANYKVGTDGMDEERAAMSEEDKKRCRPPLRIIPHRLIYPGAGNNPLMGEHTKNETLQAEFLPTFNSHGIEGSLHRIPGLRKHFIYLNNDYLFGRNVSVGDFYRPVVINGTTTMLEPLVPVESIVDMKHHSIGLVDTHRPTEDEVAEEKDLFGSDPQKYGKCRDWPIRRGIKEAVQGELYDTINPWSMTLMYNLHLIHDRLEGFPMNRRHTHVPMLFDRDIMQRMQEVDFADVSYTTRKSKFRATNNIATEFMYIYYAGAHRRERGTLETPAYCARLEHHPDYPNAAIMDLYHQWNHAETYTIDRRWRYVQFHQVGKSRDPNVVDLAKTIKQWKRGEKSTSMFMAVNDDFPKLSDEEFVETRDQFRELMNLLVSRSPPSKYEKPSEK